MKIEVYNNPNFYLIQPNNSIINIESLWNEIRSKYEQPGQYADNDLMMATVKTINIDIQLYGGSNTLLCVEDRIPRHTNHLLYCGIATLVTEETIMIL